MPHKLVITKSVLESKCRVYIISIMYCYLSLVRWLVLLVVEDLLGIRIRARLLHLAAVASPCGDGCITVVARGVAKSVS